MTSAFDTPDFDTLLMSSTDREFNVADGDFSQLEIKRSRDNDSFLYFYDNASHRLITDFVLHNGPRVATICTVTLVQVDGEHTPRLKFWKKDKTKAGKTTLELPIEDLPETRMIKAAVDINDGHRNFWRLVDYLQACRELSIPKERFRAVTDDSAQLAEMLQGAQKDALVSMMSKLVGGNLTQADLDLMANRKGQLEEFELLLTNEQYFLAKRKSLGNNKKVEDVWQDYFERNKWVFGYGLNLIACQSFDPDKLEKFTTGNSVFDGSGKRVDALMRTRGIVSSLLFCEIKRPDTDLLSLYRAEDVFRPTAEVVGAVAQVQKTADKAIRRIREYVYTPESADGDPADYEVATVRPRQIVIVGTTEEFKANGKLNRQKVSSFEFYRRSVNDVEIITFDELLARARFIVADA
ncbi:Shedu immune nuclease family protein [Nocardia abscessus]|uniref:Shedu immune nuclease family protein n=1 Tax=Nocardia abscessus TaxID=120957 RepID=UPI002457AC95|nr:DUF4263 domain-containing protein [Nocardia abscessus]